MQNISAITKNSFCDAPKIAVEHSGWLLKQGNNLHEAISSASILEKLKDKPTQINAVSCSSTERDRKGNYQLQLRSMASIEKKKINLSSPSSSISWNSDDSVGNSNNNNKITSQSSPDGGTLRIHEDYAIYARQQPARANKTESMQNHSKSTSEGATERTSNYSIAKLEQINSELSITKQASRQAQTAEGCNITKQRTNGLRQGNKTTEINEEDQLFAEKENFRESLSSSKQHQMLLGNTQERLKLNGKINSKTLEGVENELKENRDLLSEQKQWISHWKMKAAVLEQKEKENKVRFKELEETLRFSKMQFSEAQQKIMVQEERIKDAENKVKNVNVQLEVLKIQAEEADRKAQAAERQGTEAIQRANQNEALANESIKSAQQQEELTQIALQKLHEAENKVEDTEKQTRQAIERSEQAETQLKEAVNRVKIVEGMRDEFRQKVIDAQNQVEEYNNLTIQYQNKILQLEGQIKQLLDDNAIARQQSENYYLDLQDARQSWKSRESEMIQGQLVLKEQLRNLKEVLEQTERELRIARVDNEEMKEEFIKKMSESESKLATNSLELERVVNKNKEYLRNIDSLTNNTLTITKTHQFKLQHIEDQHKAMLEIAIEREGKAKRQEYETKIFYLDSQLKLLTKELTFWREKYASEEQQQYESSN